MYPNLVQSRIFCVLRKTRAINGGEKTRKGVGRQKTEEKGETRSLGKKDLGINHADALPPLLPLFAVERDHLFPGGRPMYHTKPRGGASRRCKVLKTVAGMIYYIELHGGAQ